MSMLMRVSMCVYEDGARARPLVKISILAFAIQAEKPLSLAYYGVRVERDGVGTL